MAATTRTSTLVGREAPTRLISPDSSARRSFACRSRGSSPISSRKRVPPSASSNAPLRAFTAPVKAPFSWPNSSLSMSSLEMAAQLTGMKGLSARSERVCTARATSSLPVPDSPKIATAAVDGATRSMRSASCRTEASLPMMPWKLVCLARRRRRLEGQLGLADAQGGEQRHLGLEQPHVAQEGAVGRSLIADVEEVCPGGSP